MRIFRLDGAIGDEWCCRQTGKVWIRPTSGRGYLSQSNRARGAACLWANEGVHFGSGCRRERMCDLMDYYWEKRALARPLQAFAQTKRGSGAEACKLNNGASQLQIHITISTGTFENNSPDTPARVQRSIALQQSERTVSPRTSPRNPPSLSNLDSALCRQGTQCAASEAA